MRDSDDLYVAPATEEDSLYDQYQLYNIALISRQDIRSVHTTSSSGDKSETNLETLKLPSCKGITLTSRFVFSSMYRILYFNTISVKESVYCFFLTNDL